MNKTELIEIISQEAGISKSEATKSLDAYVGAITKVLRDGDQVAIPGFGTFCVSNRAARTGRNPRTGDPIEIPASRVPKFKPGKGLKEAIA